MWQQSRENSKQTRPKPRALFRGPGHGTLLPLLQVCHQKKETNKCAVSFE